MASGAGFRSKFRFSARVEYVTEDFDHAGHVFYMFNIKVVAEQQDGSSPLQWSVIKSEDDFLQTHKVLRHKYGLLKSFYFRNPSAVGNNMFHLTNTVKPRREKKDEFLTQILALDPIPDEVAAFLCLDNATFFIGKADGTPMLEGGPPSSVPMTDHATSTTPSVVASPVPDQRYATVTATAVPIPQKPRKWWHNVSLVASIAVLLGAAWLVSTAMSSVGKATGISSDNSYANTLLRLVGGALHYQLILLRTRLEVVVIVTALWLYTHRVLGYALGLYLRTLLDPQRTGKFAFHFEWIAVRLGLDQNMIVLHGVEWRNPTPFKETPYLLRVHELCVTVDAMSVYRAIVSSTAIRVKEIRFNKVTLHLEKLSAKAAGRSDKKIESGGSAANLAMMTGEGNSTKDSSGTSAAPSTTTATATTLKAGVLNLWAAMGAMDAAQEASMLNNVSGQMDSASDSAEGTSVVGAVGAVMQKYNPTSFLYKSGVTVGSTLGSTLGAGVGMLSRGMSTKKVDFSQVEVDEGGEDAVRGGHDEAALKSALEESLGKCNVDEADSFDEYDSDTPSSPSRSPPPAATTAAAASGKGPSKSKEGTPTAAGAGAGAAAEAAPPARGISRGTTLTAEKPATSASQSSTAKVTAADGPKKGFGFPYLLEIEALQLDRLELHAQDFLNASHSTHFSASVIKLKSLSMSHKDLTKPPKNDGSTVAAGRRPKRRPLYLDEVVWRLVNKLLADLIKNNSIAMMVLLSSAAANNATSVVTSAGSLAYAGASTGGRLLTRVGSVFVGPGSSAGVSAPVANATTTISTSAASSGSAAAGKA